MKKFDSKFAKRSAMVLLSFLLLAAGVFVTNVRAQTSGAFEVQIPFDFVVDKRTYGSGTYRVARLNAANPDTLILKTENGKKSLILLTERHVGGPSIAISKLTFSRYGAVYFLDTIRASGQDYESRVASVRASVSRDTRGQLAQTVSINAK